MIAPQTVSQQLVGLFNDALAQLNIDASYLESDITFAAPVPYDPETIDASEPESANTTIDATVGEGLEQIAYRLHYCRLDLGFLASKTDDFFEAALDTTPTAHALLNEISAALGMPVTVDDIEDTPLTDVTATDANLLVVAKATSLGFRGQVSMTVMAPVVP